MKKSLKTLLALLLVIGCIGAVTACGDAKKTSNSGNSNNSSVSGSNDSASGDSNEGSGGDQQQTVVDKPQNLHIKNGKLQWDPVGGCDGYAYSYDGETYADTTKESCSLSFDTVGDCIVYVKAKKYETYSDAATFSYKVANLTAPNVTIEGLGNEAKFVWSEVECAKGYQISLDDGETWRNWTAMEYSPYVENSGAVGSYSLLVKAIGGTIVAATETTLTTVFADSLPSIEVSKIDIFDAPVLELDGGVITFNTMGDSYTYDLLIDDTLAAENIVSGTNVYDGIVTVTGDYQLKISVKKNGAEYVQSNAVRLQTGFLNENEIYSFENNYAAKTSTKNSTTNLVVLSEKTYNNSKYALKVTSEKDTDSVYGRFTLDLTEREVSKNARISYWIYIPRPEGVTADATTSRFDYPNALEPSKNWYCRTFTADGTTSIPYDAWTKIYTYVHGCAPLNTLTFAWTVPVDDEYVFYMDDIYVENLPCETGDGIHNIVITSDNGGSYTFTSEDYGDGFAVGDLVDVTMKIKNSTTDVGTDYGFYTVKVGGEDKTIASKTTYSTEWTEVSFRVAVTAAQTNLKNWQMNTEEGISLVWLNTSLPMGYISMKDVTFTKYVPTETPATTADISFTGVSAGEGGICVLDVLETKDFAVGTVVNVTLKLALSNSGDYTRLHVVAQGTEKLTDKIIYGFASGPNASTQVATLKSGEYIEVSFTAVIIDQAYSFYNGTTTPAGKTGVAFGIISMKEANDMVWIKDVSIVEKA